MECSGGCLCGRVRFDADGPPNDVHYCHCSMCRRATGGPAAVLVWYDTHRIRWTADPPALFRSSPIAERGFCPRCGSPLLLRYDGEAATALTVGSFDDARGLVPTHHYGAEGRLPWYDAGARLSARPTDPDQAARVRGEDDARQS